MANLHTSFRVGAGIARTYLRAESLRMTPLTGRQISSVSESRLWSHQACERDIRPLLRDPWRGAARHYSSFNTTSSPPATEAPSTNTPTAPLPSESPVAEILNSEEPVGEADVVRPTESQADIIADRSWSTPAAPAHLNPLETVIYTKLSEVFRPETLSVQDISGGCGSMYGIEICAEEFRGLGLLKQQRAVIKVLKGVEGFDGWHGVQVKTSVPKA